MMKILQRGQQGRPRSLNIGKSIFLPLYVSELGLGVFMKVVDVCVLAFIPH